MTLNNAQKIIETFKNRDINQALETFIVEQNDELTNEVRAYLDSLDENSIKEVQNFLYKLLNLCYQGNITGEDKINDLLDKLSTEQIFLLKETVIYFLGRLSILPDIEILKKAYFMDEDKYVKLNLTFASLCTFDEEIELDFVEKLVPHSEYDQMLRSWTMAFFTQADNPYDYKDQKGDDWSKAKTPRLNRLSINEEENPKFTKAMSFRLLDLVVLYLFLENRETESLTIEEKQIVENASVAYPKYSELKKAKMNDLKRMILSR